LLNIRADHLVSLTEKSRRFRDFVHPKLNLVGITLTNNNNCIFIILEMLALVSFAISIRFKSKRRNPLVMSNFDISKGRCGSEARNCQILASKRFMQDPYFIIGSEKESKVPAF